MATVSQLILCVPFLRKMEYRHIPILDVRDRHIKEMVFVALPLIMGTAVNEINVPVNRTFGSRIARLAVSRRS